MNIELSGKTMKSLQRKIGKMKKTNYRAIIITIKKSLFG
jgi:hypothetical protein